LFAPSPFRGEGWGGGDKAARPSPASDWIAEERAPPSQPPPLKGGGVKYGAPPLKGGGVKYGAPPSREEEKNMRLPPPQRGEEELTMSVGQVVQGP